MDMTERQQGAYAALAVMATKCEWRIARGDAMMGRFGESHELTQVHRTAIYVLRDAAEAIRVEAMLPPEMVPDVLRTDYQPSSAKMDAVKVALKVSR